MRILLCLDCKSMEEVPDFDGPPEFDILLESLVERHRSNGEQHLGNLIHIEQEQWDKKSVRDEILKQVKDGLGPGLGDEFYDTKSTYQEDAMKCFNEHGRPKGRCIDWMDDRKRLGNPTKAGWQRGPKVYLCQFCPVATHVVTEIRHKRGDYK